MFSILTEELPYKNEPETGFLLSIKCSCYDLKDMKQWILEKRCKQVKRGFENEIVV